MKLFIIVLHFGESDLTEKCVKSIFRYEKEFEEIVVVDNNSEFRIENSELRELRKIEIIRNDKNLGYAGGMNRGIRYALLKKADYVLLLNKDVVFEEKILSKLVKFLKINKDAGIVSPAIKFQRNGKIVYDLGGKVNKIFGRTSHIELSSLLKEDRFWTRQNDINRVDYVSGCCMLIKKEVFEKIGLFDENFFLYYEDVDFCLRAKRENFNTYVLPSAFIYHKLSESVGKNSKIAIYNQIRSALLFGQKYFGIKRPLNFLFVFLQSFVFMVKNPRSGVFAFYAIVNFLKERK